MRDDTILVVEMEPQFLTYSQVVGELSRKEYRLHVGNMMGIEK
jgi:hypothetical protein